MGLVLLMAGVAAAQWINYPTPGVPKNADGSANLTRLRRGGRMASRIFQGCGCWRRISRVRRKGVADMEITKEFMNIGWSLPGGLTLSALGAGVAQGTDGGELEGRSGVELPADGVV